MITQERLKELLLYCPITGYFLWKVTNHNHSMVEGIVAGHIDEGYIRITLDDKMYRAHRLAWLYTHGEFPKGQIDHTNHVKNDNRFSNLRDVTQQENHRNVPKSKRNTSGVVGVFWRKDSKRWRAQITIDNKKVNLGSYSKFSEAVDARKLAEVTYNFHENHGK